MVRIDSGHGVAAGASRGRRLLQRLLFTAVLSVMIAAAVVGALAARHEAQETAERRSALAARQGAVALERLFDDLRRALGGSQAILSSDGTLQIEVFETFAEDAFSHGEPWGLALVGIVAGADREAFEDSLGVQIWALDGGRLADVDDAARYYPVLGMHPDVEWTSVEEFDFASDPVRRAALQRADATGKTVVSDLTLLSAGGEPAVAVVRPLAHRRGGVAEVRGFLVAEVPGATIWDILREAVGVSMAVTVLRDGEVLDGRSHGVEEPVGQQSARIGDETWKVAVQPLSGPDMALAWLVGGGGGVAVLAMLALFAVTERHQRAINDYAAQVESSDERGWALQELAGELTRAATVEEVMVALLSGLPRAVGAAEVAIGMRDGTGLVVLEDDGEDPRHLSVAGTGSWLERVMISQEPVWLHDPLDWRHDSHTSAMARGARSLAVLPFTSGPAAGVLVVGYGRYHILTDAERSVLSTVSLLAGRALARGHRYDADHDAAVEFQRAALPTELPHIDGLTTAARYLPATQGAAVGGDWYDAVVIDDHRGLLIVGDVVGHGMAAAATMGRLRTAFRVIAAMYAGPDEILTAVNSHVEEAIPEAFCTTAICAVVDMDQEQIHCARAGHLPALLVRSGDAKLLDGRGCPPLGVIPDAIPTVHNHPLQHDDMLVLYTDGLVERPGEDIDHSLERLRIAAGALADLCPDEFCDTLVHALAAGPGQRDDIAVLAVRLQR